MSVLVTVKVRGDVPTFQRALAERRDEFAAIAKRSRSQGAVHHRFGLGDGYVLVVDEWESGAHFEKFFGDPDLQAFIGSIGGDTTAPPDITIADAVDSVDQF